MRTINQVMSFLFLCLGVMRTEGQTDIVADIVQAASSTAVTAQSMSLRQIVEAGGWLMYVLGLLSVVALALIFYFIVVLRRSQIIPPKFVAGVRDLLIHQRWAEAHAACKSNSSAMASIILAALDYMLRVDKPDTSLLREIIEGEGGRQASLIQNQTQYLLDIAVIAPMIGLLGTVMGMLQAFNVVALDLAKAKPMLLASGVAQALITTVAGLIVAIPAMMAYAYFRGQTSKLISDLETTSADAVTLMVMEKKS